MRTNGFGLAALLLLKPNAGLGGTNAVTGSWAARAAEVQALPPIAQPFVH
jgi:hypothetical protein